MRERLTDFGLLWLRILVGLALMYHGWIKVIGGMGGFEESVGKMGVPFDYAPLLFAWLSTLAELLGGFFILLGLWTRYAAIVLSINLAIAAFVRNGGNPIIQPGNVNTLELPLTYLTITVAIFIMGAGRYSVDNSRSGGGAGGARRSKK